MGGLDEDRPAAGGDLRVHLPRFPAIASLSHPDIGDLGNPERRHQIFEQNLVHAYRRGRHSGADIGDVEHLEQALNGAVLAEGPVQRREDDLHARDALAGSDGDRIPLAPPDPVAADLDPHYVVATGQQPVANGGRRGERDLVLG